MTDNHRPGAATDRRPRRGPLIAAAVVLLLTAVAVIVYPPPRWFSRCDAPDAGDPVVLRGVVGSESADLLADPQLTECLDRAGIRLEPVERGGSLEIPARRDLDQFDFAFPSSAPAADRLRLDRRIPSSDSPWFSPMVVATYQPVVDTLRRAGVVTPAPDGTLTLDVAALVDVVARGRRWGDLPGNTVPAPGKAVLLSTTNPDDSNSAAMLLSIASYAENGNRIVTDRSQIDAVLPRVCPLIRQQGYTESSSQYLFNRYLTTGVGNTPMALVYENQFRAAERNGLLRPGQVMLYPSPTVLSRYSLVPLHSDADRLVRELAGDPGVADRAEAFGFRPAHPMPGRADPEPLPATVVDTPAYDVLNELTTRVSTECR